MNILKENGLMLKKNTNKQKGQKNKEKKCGNQKIAGLFQETLIHFKNIFVEANIQEVVEHVRDRREV